MIFRVTVRSNGLMFRQTCYLRDVQIVEGTGNCVTCVVNVNVVGLFPDQYALEAARMARLALEWNIDKDAAIIVHDEHDKFMKSFVIKTVETETLQAIP